MSRVKTKLVHGVGVNDLDDLVLIPVTSKGRELLHPCPIYKAWEGMLCRCYSKKWKEKYPTYEDCYVVPEWHSRKAFTEWVHTQDWRGKQLDKDILFHGNKVYGPDTCVFVSGDLNKFLTNTTQKKGEKLVGACFDKSIMKYRGICSDPFLGRQRKLGTFSTQEEAHYAWALEKLDIARKIAKTQTDQRIAVALISRFEGVLALAESNLHEIGLSVNKV
jgi:hypothetical protein